MRGGHTARDFYQISTFFQFRRNFGFKQLLIGKIRGKNHFFSKPLKYTSKMHILDIHPQKSMHVIYGILVKNFSFADLVFKTMHPKSQML